MAVIDPLSERREGLRARKRRELRARLVTIAGRRFTAEGYDIQTLRLATQPLPRYLGDWMQPKSIAEIQALDRFATDNGVSCSIGPVIIDDAYQDEFANWAVEVIRETTSINFTVSIASPDLGIHHRSLRAAAEAMLAIAGGTPGGTGNFRFAANAFTRAGTPFFPAAFFEQGETFLFIGYHR